MPGDLFTVLVSDLFVGDTRQCVVGREMTKLHEEFWRGTLHDAHQHFKDNPTKVYSSAIEAM